MWGLDSVGPFRTAPDSYRHILVAVDKFTKWIEVRPVAKVTSEEVAKFIGDITHRFGVPNRIITDRYSLCRLCLLGFLSRQHHRCLLLLGRPPSVQRPG
jgi:hypothetical protein